MKEKRFGLKFYLYNLIIVVALVGLLFSLFLWYYIRNTALETEQQLEDVLEVGLGSVEDSIQMLDTIALQLSTNSNIVSTMKGIPEWEDGNYFDVHPRQSLEIYELFWSYILKPENVSRISVYNTSGDYIYTGEVNATEELIVRADSFVLEVETQFESKNINSIFVNNVDESTRIERKGVSVIREVKDSYLTDNTALGYIEVELNVDKLEAKIINQSENQVMMVYDLDTNKIIATSIDGYTENTQWTYMQLIQHLDLEDGILKQGELGAYRLGVIVVQDMKVQNLFVRNVVILYTIICIWLLIIMAIIQRRVVQNLMKPLIHLCQNVQYSRNKQDRTTAIEESNIYEIELLSTAFKDMVVSLEDSVQKELEIKTAQTKTQLYALQAQMNPHFIHNTIAIIQSYAIEEDYDTIYSTCGYLSDLIRYSSRLTNYKVSMDDEIQHIMNYMALVKLRYEENISYTITLPEEMKILKIPCFILQPLVENSMNHGLKRKAFPWDLKIYCYIRENNWIIELRDNGVGISVSEKNKILRYKSDLFGKDKACLLSHNEMQIGGLTIPNIITRLYLEYDEKMIFEVESKELLYTIIRLGGPIDD